MSPVHTVLRDATLIDGTGAPPRRADVAIEGDRVAAIGSVSEAEAPALQIDASDRVVAPGFIDVHTHDDFAAVLHPDMAFKLEGGVTSCVVGNCGLGAAPFGPASGMARAFHPGQQLPPWEGYGGYLDRLAAHPASVNVATLVGHGTLRLEAMGGSEKREPTGTELSNMKALLGEGLEAGAVGFSTGLVYEPGRFATTEEIVELAAEMAGSGALYATHMRNEGPKLLDSVAEAIEIGERAGVPVQISHHKAAGRESWGLVERSLGLIEAAQARGLDVHADQYPYTAGSTILAAVAQHGGLRSREGGADAGLGRTEASDVVVASTADHPEWEGRSLADLAAAWGVDGQAALERVLAAEPLATAVMHSMSEDDVRTVMRHPSTMIGSDGIPSLAGKPHPRLYGTFARVLGRYARDLGLLTLEDAVHRMTGFAAQKFGLNGRGVVREGAFADLVVFDPTTILDVGTYEDPKHAPAGIQHVFVNGVHSVRDGRHTGARAGTPLRRGHAA